MTISALSLAAAFFAGLFFGVLIVAICNAAWRGDGSQ